MRVLPYPLPVVGGSGRAGTHGGIEGRRIIRPAGDVLESERTRGVSDQPVQKGVAGVECDKACVCRIAQHPEDRCDWIGDAVPVTHVEVVGLETERGHRLRFIARTYVPDRRTLRLEVRIAASDV